MKTLFFKNTLTGKNEATYMICQQPPSSSNSFYIQIENIPDDVPTYKVQTILNQTAVYNPITNNEPLVVDYNNLGFGKIIKGNWGGTREGAGRPSTGRKKQNYYITDEEHEDLRAIIEVMRASDEHKEQLKDIIKNFKKSE